MNFHTRQQQSDDQKIHDIVIAFGTYGLGDIESNVNQGKPIAAFILGSCWIDQVALFVYNHNQENIDQHYRAFIKQYLNKYAEMDLYTNLRCKLVHSYSVGQYIRLTTEDTQAELHTKGIHANFITAKMLHLDLAQAWEIVKTELETEGHSTRTCALKQFAISPPLVEASSNLYSYTTEECKFLIGYFTPKVKGKFLNNKKQLEITGIVMEPYHARENEYVLLAAIKKSKTKSYCEYLERVTQQLSLPLPIDVLAEEFNL
jgi:hypothetical protein